MPLFTVILSRVLMGEKQTFRVSSNFSESLTIYEYNRLFNTFTLFCISGISVLVANYYRCWNSNHYRNIIWLNWFNFCSCLYWIIFTFAHFFKKTMYFSLWKQFLYLYIFFQVLNDTGIHHLRLLHLLGKMAFFLFLPLWAIYDAYIFVFTTKVVSYMK